MAELLGRRPLLPGKDYVDQLKLIIKTLGPPSEDDLTFITSHKARAYIRALPPAEVRRSMLSSSILEVGHQISGKLPLSLVYSASLPKKVDFQKKFPEADPLAIDLMQKMMQFDPRKRCTVVEALKHPWLAQLHDEAAEPFAPGEDCCSSASGLLA